MLPCSLLTYAVEVLNMEWNFPIWFGSGIWFYAGFLGLLLAGEPGIPTSSAVTTHTQNPPNNANKLFFSAQFHTSGRLVSSRKHGNSPSLASLQNRNSVGTFDLGACRKSGSYPMPDGRWLVITKQRSGSRWLVDTMTERTGGLVPYTREITCGGCYCGEAGLLVSGSEENHCTCKLAQFYKDAERATTLGDSPGAIRYSGADGPTSARRHHYGFKFMSPTGVLHTIPGAFDVLARSVCNLNIPVIFMWRRNILRRLVSAKSNKLTRKEGMYPKLIAFTHMFMQQIFGKSISLGSQILRSQLVHSTIDEGHVFWQ